MIEAIEVSIPLRQAKNLLRDGQNVLLILFQFLLGRLKTGRMTNIPFLAIGVSIPLRQAKNHMQTYIVYFHFRSFNSS